MLICDQMSYLYPHNQKGIKKIDFTTDSGDIIGIIGENGAGKSTLFKCLLGILKPQTGEITVKGKTLSYSKKALIAHRQYVNMVLQDPERQLFHTSVYDDVAMGPKNLGFSDAVVKERTKRGIADIEGETFLNTPIQYLSFGQKKRVAIAGVLALACETLLLDEPETGLDPEMKKAMIALIRQLSRQGVKIVLASHNMDLIYQLCDYVYVMHAGEMILKGPTHHVMTQEAVLEKVRLEVPMVIKIANHLNIDAKKILEAL